MISMYDMAVRMGGERAVEQDYYEAFQNFVPGYYMPDYTVYQPTYLPQNPPHRSWNNFDWNHHYTLPVSQMSVTKKDFANLDRPELTSYNTATSPTSSFTSADPFTPPSFSQDAKILQPMEHGFMGVSFAHSVPSPSQDAKILQPNEYDLMGSSFTYSVPSPSSTSSDGTYHTALSPTWSTPATVLGNDLWNGPQYPADQLVENPLRSTTTNMVLQPSFDSFTPFGNPFCTTSSIVAEPINMTGYVGDGLVVPGHLSLAPSMPTFNADMAADPVQARQPGITRSEQDDYIQEARRRGLSYKEIKRTGGFSEAESTLRGRHRILSKPKEMRVRKPQWGNRDVMILRQAVECFANGPRGRSGVQGMRRRHSSHRGSNSSKLPWKKIAECIQASGASYPFAGAACAKKWDEIRNSS